ncbi:MAG: penicillin-binding protein 1A [Thermodesulfobacteriota bacterium]
MKRWLLAVLKWILRLVLAGLIIGGVTIGAVYFYFSRDLPQITSLADYQPPVVTSFFSDDGRKIAEFYKKRRIVIPMSEMPDQLVKAFVAAEDARFYQHEGIDFYSIVRAFSKNIEAGTIVQGGSTITQQVAKSFFLTSKRSYTRKLKEAILAYRIDKYFLKNEILYLYLNQIYLGHGAYGVEAAAQNYFGKTAKELNLAECAMLAGLPQAPSRYSPHRHLQRAKDRQIYVLNRMVAEGFITNAQASEAISTNVAVKSRPNWFMDNVPYYAEHVRQMIEEKYGREKLYKGGLKVYTCVNIEMQETARNAVETGLRELDKRRGYRGPIRHLEKEEIENYCRGLQEKIDKKGLHKDLITKGVVIAVNDGADRVDVRIGKAVGTIALKDMRWALQPAPEVAESRVVAESPGEVLDVGDVIRVRLEKWQSEQNRWRLFLEQTPKVQSALMSVSTDNGHVKSMVGGRDFAQSQFNRAVRSRRQPGSAFKPIIYAAALDKGYTPATVIADTPIVFEDTKEDFTWKPKNYDKTFHGFTLFRDGLIHSRNVITVKILRDIGIDYIIDYSRDLGITSHLDRNLSLALGSSGMSLLELVRAYSVFANRGQYIAPVFIDRIENRNGKVIYESDPGPERVIDKSTAYIITHLLEEVVEHGTGRRIKALNRPVAGKTGTTNNLNDAWFMGYTPRYVTGVWVGFDQERSMGEKETGSRAASPIWLDYMQTVLEGKPERVFPVPDNVVFAKIDAKTGLRPSNASQKVIYECFKEGTVPREHTQRPDEITETDEFFKKGIQ